ncbi:MAG: small subunit ribosomal protein [Patescibacteria group bacterium]|nr:small subunit ribosomal protein [Patescibacteria group bacterium]
MTDHKENTNEEIINEAAVEATEAVATTAPVAAPAAAAPFAPRTFSNGPRRNTPGGRDSRGGGRGAPGAGGDRRGGPRREPRAKPEYDQKIIDIRRVTRVASGGRRFSFAVSLVAGDRKGKVGVGTGKGGDTSLAVDKALRSAKKNMITLSLTKTHSIPHEVLKKVGASVVHMMPAPGKGVVAGSSVRDVIELAGIKNITAKLRSGTKNKLNNARVAIEALKMLKKPRAHSK